MRIKNDALMKKYEVLLPYEILSKVVAESTDVKLNCLMFIPLTTAIRGSGYKFFVTLYHEPAVQLEHYLQNGTDSRRPR